MQLGEERCRTERMPSDLIVLEVSHLQLNRTTSSTDFGLEGVGNKRAVWIKKNTIQNTDDVNN